MYHFTCTDIESVKIAFLFISKHLQYFHSTNIFFAAAFNLQQWDVFTILFVWMIRFYDFIVRLRNLWTDITFCISKSKVAAVIDKYTIFKESYMNYMTSAWYHRECYYYIQISNTFQHSLCTTYNIMRKNPIYKYGVIVHIFFDS